MCVIVLHVITTECAVCRSCIWTVELACVREVVNCNIEGDDNNSDICGISLSSSVCSLQSSSHAWNFSSGITSSGVSCNISCDVTCWNINWWNGSNILWRNFVSINRCSCKVQKAWNWYLWKLLVNQLIDYCNNIYEIRRNLAYSSNQIQLWQSHLLIGSTNYTHAHTTSLIPWEICYNRTILSEVLVIPANKGIIDSSVCQIFSYIS